ncbi:RhuM family protein [Roseiflexus sp. RS-1]|jgi:prophage maintenance system killer protein|uniref:RhuM family protein n=1 Tax=Roseiflexus sp. (strain RS-1) TaxID=357808 RepID=UPI0000D8167F|nr:RhuM family protein [Roseiflexus sp. RS-1]ABQ88712.1 Death-on-curing protein [Roseiflexus sp. RS-1]
MNGTPEIVIYEGGEARVEVRVERENVWLSLQQLADLFGRDKSVISRHLRNIFATGELERDSVVAKNATTAADGKTYLVEYYSLDAIISVGYRVNSTRATRFRQWATRILRDHLLIGYTLNERRLAERGLAEAQQAIALLARTLMTHALVTNEGQAVLDVVQRYTRSWQLLLAYDEQRLSDQPRHAIAPRAALPVEDARAAVASLRNDLVARGEAGPLFGQERGETLAGILGAIEQTFDGKPLYPSVQIRAAHLLYFVIKDHPFADGNKRIDSLLFLEYLRRNGLLLRADGAPRLAANAMVALALLIAESDRTQKDLMIRLTLNLLEDDE